MKTSIPIVMAGLILLTQTGTALDKETSLVTKQAIGELAVAGRLSVDLHAEFMVSRSYGTETVLNWYNCGYSGGGGKDGSVTTVGGDFGDFGFQVPYAEREKRYPHAVTLDHVRAVHFDGSNFMKGNFAVENQLAGAQPLALEVWFSSDHPAAGDVILGWQSRDGKESSAPLTLPPGFNGTGKWRHLLVNCTPQKEDWYLDGTRISSGKRNMLIKEGHIMVLGGASASQPSFKGNLVAVRLHNETMKDEEIAHNFAGGVMLGTEMHNWWRTEPDKWYVVESEHFRHAVDKEEMKKWDERGLKEFNERIPGMFRMAELVYHIYSERLALRTSVVSREPDRRGDGIKYKTPIQPNAGSTMGCNDDFGWCCQGAGFINPHELVHGWDAQTGGMAGNYWEVNANFPQTYGGIYQQTPVSTVWTSHVFPANGRTYYGDRAMFEHLAQTPEYGPMFISKLWFDGPNKKGEAPYPWIAFNRVNPYPERTLANEYAKMTMRNVTWDYVTFAEAKDGLGGNTPFGNDGVVSQENIYQKEWSQPNDRNMRHGRTILEKIAYDPEWWRVPKSQAPQQLGYNICPLQFKPGKVSATLAGYVDENRAGDWRAGFVGVNGEGKPVYGEIFGPEKTQEFDATTNIKELYLVVCAVPEKILDIDMCGDFRSFEQQAFPYAVKLHGCEPKDVVTPEKPNVPGKAHGNGGGFVANSAKVDASAYVGPNAQVLGNAVVTGNARIEDFAVVKDNAKVSDHSIISGHALVMGNATVSEYAKVRDFAKVLNRATISGNARILEHATLDTQKTCTDKVTIKGSPYVYGGSQSGTTMIDGFYAKGQDNTRGKWFTWSWGGGKNPGESDEDFGGLYADYEFDTPHEWMAMDSHGATWGYLINGAKVEILKNMTKFKPGAILTSLAPKKNIGENYCQSLRGYLLPPVTGNYTFSIEADDEGEFWIGKAGSTKADQEICYFHIAPPSKTSAIVHLEQGKAYPFTALQAESHGLDYISISWIKPGSDETEIIGGSALSITADGRSPGVCQRIWKDVSTLTELVKRPDYPDGDVLMDEGALSLNGKNQFVELQKDVADLRDTTIKAHVLWKGGANQRLFEFSNARGDSAYLTPSENQRCQLVIRVGSKEQRITAPALTPGKWTDLIVTLQDDICTLIVDGKETAENRTMTLHLDDIGATSCMLGRGMNGGFFHGLIDSFQIYSIALVDKAAPKPNPPEWSVKPLAINGTALVMRAKKGIDDSSIEYHFADTLKQFDSGWRTTPDFLVNGLTPGKTYKVVFEMRDTAGNRTKASEPVSITMPIGVVQPLASIADGVGVINALTGKTSDTERNAWKEKPNDRFPGGKAIETDDRGWTANINDVVDGITPRVDYRVDFKKAGKYFLTARCFSPHGGNNSILSGADFTSTPVLVEFEPGKPVWCKPIELNIALPGSHLVQLWMAQDGAAVDTLAISGEIDSLPKGEEPAPGKEAHLRR